MLESATKPHKKAHFLYNIITTIHYTKVLFMRLDNFIQTAMKNTLQNPIIEVLREIRFSSILKQSIESYEKDVYYRFRNDCTSAQGLF